MQPARWIAMAAIAALAVAGAGTYVALNIPRAHTSSGSAIRVVAAENFWGSLVAQIGGKHVTVLSIVTDPNTDPHDYESNASTARAIAMAQLVVVNGAGYDDWALKLIAAGSASNQAVLNVATLLGVTPGTNPHFWYSPTYVNTTVRAMYEELVAIDPGDAAYFHAQYQAVELSLGQVYGRVAVIHHQFLGVRIASTESIVQYLADASGLDLISPPDFMKAVAEGADPPAQSVVVFQNQLAGGNVSVMLYNQQTVTPLTQSLKALATQHNIPVVGVTETIQPPDVSFQLWMTSELITLQNALSLSFIGH